MSRRNTRHGLVSEVKSVEPLRALVNQGIEEIHEVLAAITAAGERRAALDGARRNRLSDRFDVLKEKS